jgi:hypothetical protein
MANKDNYLYPVTEATMHKYAASIFNPIRKGECVTTVWVPIAGRRFWNKFIIENIQLFSKELPDYKKYILVYIDPLELTEESLAGYLRLMAKNFFEVCKDNAICKGLIGSDERWKIFEDETASYSKLLEALKTLLGQVVSSGLKVVFFLGEFNEMDFANTLFYNNLKSLWSKLHSKLCYIFLVREDITKNENNVKWSELNEAIFENIVYVSLRNDRDTDYLINVFSKEYSISPTDEEKQLIKKLCGGHPYMLRIALKVISKHQHLIGKIGDLEKLLLGQYEFQTTCRIILDTMQENHKTILKAIAQGKVAEESSELEFLKNLGIVTTNIEGKQQIFGKIFELAAAGSESKKQTFEDGDGNLILDQITGTILLRGKAADERFTRQEYSILSVLLQNPNKLYSRDDIGNILWGKDSYEKYSDWAIDQVMSKVRRKLAGLETKTRMVTIRGRGYKLVLG